LTRLPGLLERFPSRELDIRRLCARDTEFRGVCEDYEVALKALRHWERVENNAARADEYRQLADEIADEIASCLDAASASLRAPERARSG
jgi:crotonobetainyl-CoA:carnitine CoA-transferase CaiB-like acyl-CoA transferase